MINDFVKNHIMEPAYYSGEANIHFDQGRNAMIFSTALGSSRIKNLCLTVIPGPGNEQAVYLSPFEFFCISSESKNKNQAEHFINWFITDIKANIILNAEFGVPAVADVRKELMKNKNERTQNIYQYIDFVGRYSKRPIDTVFPEKERDCLRVLTDLVYNVYEDKIKPDEAADKLIIEWKRLLKE